MANLRRARLLDRVDPQAPNTLDTHPLVREHFGEQLKESNPAAWQEAHSRLYEYYKSSSKELPDTLEEMAPLFAAVRHGCEAGRHQEALDEVYSARINRGDEAFSVKKLGAFGADLAALSGFFDTPWSQPVSGITEDSKGFVMGQAGHRLRALGRLTEAAQPTQAGNEAAITLANWRNAARGAGNLSELYLTIGDLPQALDYARQSVDLADRSDEAYERMGMRTALADAQHQSGLITEAEAVFQDAEAIQKERQPPLPLLYALYGYRYCDLLLDQDQWQDVQDRATQTLEWARQAGAGLLTNALDHLSLGRACLLKAEQAGTKDFTPAAEHLTRAVDGLRQAGAQEFIARGLLGRSELHRLRGDTELARQDLEEAMSIAERGGMALHQADCHLEYARLYLAMGKKEQARERLGTAREMVNRMGYHRRDQEVARLAALLGLG